MMDLPDQLPSTNKTLTAQCYCKSVHLTITVPTSALPLPVHLCHCHICRYTHGTPCIFHAPLPRGIEPEFIHPSSLSSSLTGYEHSQAASTRFFCSTCGCHIGDRDLPDSTTSSTNDQDPLEWRVAASIFSAPSPDEPYSSIFQIRSHTFANPLSSPSGFYNWLSTISSRQIPIWNPSPTGTSPAFPIPPPRPPKLLVSPDGSERLLAQCHCAGVSFSIPRPDSVFSNPSLPEGYKSFIRSYLPPASNKWSALLDLCGDCRLIDGTHVIGWTFVPLGELEPRIKSDLKLGTLKTFESSKGVLRAFCSVCGATVFFSMENRTWRDGSGEDVDGEEEDGKHTMVDIATGILRAPEGVSAEDWLTWRTGRVGWYESGEKFDAEFARSLAKGLEDWGIKTYGGTVNFSIPD